MSEEEIVSRVHREMDEIRREKDEGLKVMRQESDKKQDELVQAIASKTEELDKFKQELNFAKADIYRLFALESQEKYPYISFIWWLRAAQLKTSQQGKFIEYAFEEADKIRTKESIAEDIDEINGLVNNLPIDYKVEKEKIKDKIKEIMAEKPKGLDV